MKTLLKQNYLLFAFVFIFQITTAQKITLAELHTMSVNKNWETSNRYLLLKGWEYYNSSEGDDAHYNTITWSFEKSNFDDKKANGWVYIYTYDGLPNKVMYRFRTKEFYTSIKNQLATSGYKLDDEDILDERVIAKYSNSNYILELTYARENDATDDLSFTAYEITVYVKGGVYDPNNGKKQVFDENGNLVAEYILKDGKINGAASFYNANGSLHRTSFYKNGLEEGLSTEFVYHDSLKTLIGKYKGAMVNNQKEGKWIANMIKDNVETTFSERTYVNGKKEGKFRSMTHDSIICGNYKNDLLYGNYSIYKDVNDLEKSILSQTDTIQLKKITLGSFLNNKKSGVWKNYDHYGTLISEGEYLDSLKTGKWKYYIPKSIDKSGKTLDYSGQLFLEENYRNGNLNGECIQYSYFEDVEKPCLDDIEKTCVEHKLIKVLETSYYIEDELNGPYELRNENSEIIRKGIYLNGKESGKWLLRNESQVMRWKGLTNEIGNFIFGKKQGDWKRYNDEDQVLESYSYVNSVIEEEHLLFAKDLVVEKRKFSNGQMVQLTLLDSAQNPITDYQLSEISTSKYVCKKIERAADGYYTTTYHINRINENDIDPFSFSIDFQNIPSNSKILEGVYQHQSLDKKPIEEGTYKNNTKVGTWIKYYYNQNIKTEFEYNLYGIIQKEFYYDLKKQEPFSGEFIYKIEGSEITEERKIKEGIRNGTTRFKDVNNKTIKKESYKDGLLKE